MKEAKKNYYKYKVSMLIEVKKKMLSSSFDLSSLIYISVSIPCLCQACYGAASAQ